MQAMFQSFDVHLDRFLSLDLAQSFAEFFPVPVEIRSQPLQPKVVKELDRVRGRTFSVRGQKVFVYEQGRFRLNHKEIKVAAYNCYVCRPILISTSQLNQSWH